QGSWRSGLFSANLREKATAALFSFLLWAVFVSGTKVESLKIVLPVRNHDLTEGLAVERLAPHRVRATVSGLRRDLYTMDPESAYVSLDLSQLDEGVHEVVLAERNFHLPPEVTLVEANPVSISVHIVRAEVPGGTDP